MTPSTAPVSRDVSPDAVRCGNTAYHGREVKVYHESAKAVRECFANTGRFGDFPQQIAHPQRQVEAPAQAPAKPCCDGTGWTGNPRERCVMHYSPPGQAPVEPLPEVSVEDVVASVRAKQVTEDQRRKQAAGERYARWATIPVENGDYAHYALVNGGGNVSFYQVRRPSTGQYAGKTYVDLEVSDETRRMPWAQSADVLDRIAADPISAAILYGQETKRCAICHRKLTKQESRERGIGPTCFANMGG